MVYKIFHNIVTSNVMFTGATNIIATHTHPSCKPTSCLRQYHQASQTTQSCCKVSQGVSQGR